VERNRIAGGLPTRRRRSRFALDLHSAGFRRISRQIDRCETFKKQSLVCAYVRVSRLLISWS
jgi:hypothetical protein